MKTKMSAGSGRFENHATPQGTYKVFFPNPLPPSPLPSLDGGMALLISEAVQALSRLDGVATILPNTNLFVAMYVKQEAVLSSQIEGTQASLEDVLAYEADGMTLSRATLRRSSTTSRRSTPASRCSTNTM